MRMERMKKFFLVAGILILCCVSAAALADVTVCFDLNGGKAGITSLKLQPDAYGKVSFRIPSEKPVRSGYNFIGWYCNGLEMEYGLCRPGETITWSLKKGTITYTAQWENVNHQSSCPYLMAWAGDYGKQMDIIQADFKCIAGVPHTYYAVHCWYDETPASGYAGFQILDDGRRIVIMSMWDSGNLKPTIEYAPFSLVAQAFSGEGPGVQVLSEYNWDIQKWYTMRIQARTTGNKTVYEQWIRPEDGAWEKIAAISFPMAGCAFNSNCTFLEDFWPFSNQRRSMQVKNMTGRLAAGGKWLKNTRFNISNYEDNLMEKYNVPYNCKAEAANAYALYMQIGGSGYEKVITVPKMVTVKKCDITDPRMLN